MEAEVTEYWRNAFDINKERLPQGPTPVLNQNRSYSQTNKRRLENVESHLRNTRVGVVWLIDLLRNVTT
jgi:hypothetical protein